MRVKVAELVEDLNLYPRHAVDTQHVTQIALALEAGETMPPIVADKKSRRIVDGFHRCRGAVRVWGDEAEVEVEFREYKSEREIILDAIRMNAHHGRRLDKMDQVRAVHMAMATGAPLNVIALALHVPEHHITKLELRVAKVAQSAPQAVPHTKPAVIALKRPVLHMQGKQMTKAQADAVESMPGTSFSLLCRQLILAIENDLVDTSDEALLEQLSALHAVLAKFVKKHAA